MKLIPGCCSCLILFSSIVLCSANELSSTPGQLDTSEVNASVAVLDQQVRSIQEKLGPHDISLIQPVREKALLLYEAGQHDDVVGALNDLIYLHRVNHGLYDMAQLQYLEMLISSNLAQKNWKAVNDNYRQLEWLQRRNFRKDSTELLEALDKLIAWHLLATALKTGTHPGEHFLELERLHEQAVIIAEAHPELGKQALAQRLYKLALVHYYIAIAVQRGAPVGQYLAHEIDPIKRGESYDTTADRIALKKFRRSRDLVARATELYIEEKDIKGANAMARLYLADWDLLFNRRVSAKQGYRETCEKLLQAGYSQEFINNFFQQPKVLPSYEFEPDLLANYDSDSEFTKSETMEFVGWSKDLPGVQFPKSAIHAQARKNPDSYSLVTFGVKKDGLAEKIKINRDNADKNLSRRITHNAIWSAQFRPRLEDGKVVAVSGLSTRFYMPQFEGEQADKSEEK